MSKKQAVVERILRREFLDLIQNIIVALDTKGCVVMINRAGCLLLGYSEDEIIGSNWFENCLLQPEGMQEVYLVFQELVTGKTQCPYVHENFVVSKNGERLLIRWHNSVLLDEDGLIVGTLSSGEDITEAKQTQESLFKSEEIYRALVNGLPDVVMRFDQKGRHLFVSKNVSNVVNFEAWQLLGKTHAQVGFPEEQCRFWKDYIQRVFKSGEPIETEFAVKNKGGKIIFNWRLLPEKDAQGKITSVLSISRDITEHRKAQKEYQTLFREMLDGFALHEIICDANGKPVDYRFLAVNPAFEAMTGLNATDVVGRTVLEVFPQTEAYWIKTYGKVALAGQPVFFDKYSDSIKKYFEVRAFRPAQGKFACIFTDITERKLAQEHRDKLNMQLIQAQKMESVGRLAGGVAHDFNNMLSVILGYTELVLEVLQEGSKERKNLEEVFKAAKRSAQLTGQLLAFARKQIIAPVMLDLNEKIKAMLKMLIRLIGEEIELVWEPAKRLWPVMIDSSQLDQLLMNLCINSKDAISGLGKIIVETQNITFGDDYCTYHAGFAPGDYVMLAVSDDGCGMDAETRSNLFEPFFTTKERGKGTGMGMPTVYGVVKQNKGFVNVYSESGQGTTIRIYLPRHMDCEEPAIKERPSQTILGSGVILLVEDDPSNLKMTIQVLERLGYTVLAAATPAEALALAKEHCNCINLLLTDVIMPEMNGRELANIIMQIYPNIRCLFMSGYTANAIAHHGVLDQGVDFIQKPFLMKELASKIKETLG